MGKLVDWMYPHDVAGTRIATPCLYSGSCEPGGLSGVSREISMGPLCWLQQWYGKSTESLETYLPRRRPVRPLHTGLHSGVLDPNVIATFSVDPFGSERKRERGEECLCIQDCVSVTRVLLR